MNRHTQVWLKKQAIWRDDDLFFAAIIGFVIGAVITKLF